MSAYQIGPTVCIPWREWNLLRVTQGAIHRSPRADQFHPAAAWAMAAILVMHRHPGWTILDVLDGQDEPSLAVSTFAT